MRRITQQAMIEDPARAIWDAVHEGGLEIGDDTERRVRLDPIDGPDALPPTLAEWRVEFACL